LGLIIPIGFSCDLKGPNIIFLIINFFLESWFRRFFLKEINLPIRDLLISYDGFRAGNISASDVFIQISFFINESLFKAISSNKFNNLNLLNALISIEFS
jgi:hypothetical protein